MNIVCFAGNSQSCIKGTVCNFLGNLLSKINILFINMSYICRTNTSANYLTYPRKRRIYYLYIHGTGKSMEASMSFRHLEKL